MHLPGLIHSLALALQTQHRSEADLVLPDLSTQTFLGMDGRSLLTIGLFVCLAGLAFGMIIYRQLKNMAAHRSMKEVSELI